ncbi:hypothetical protein S245_022878, partial [Arachis hypogaea]
STNYKEPSNSTRGIQIFSVSNNNFIGHISPTFCNASLLNALILSHNHLSRVISQCIILDLQVNNFYRSILINFSQGNEFQTIKLNDNQLEGPLPQSLANCTLLKDAFSGWLETLQELKELSLRAKISFM